MKNDPTQSGSVLLYILIAVMLFAALSYTVAQMMKSGNPGTVSEEKSFLMADDLMNFGRAVRQAVQTMKISNGCTDTAISFENSFMSGYAHTPAASPSCQIFNAAGGGIQYVTPNKEWLNTDFQGNVHFGRYFLSGANAFEGVGTPAADLVLLLPFLKSNLCAAINRKLGNTQSTDPMPEDGLNVTAPVFTGSYSTTPLNPGAVASSSALRGKMAGCLDNILGATGSVYYQVLIPR